MTGQLGHMGTFTTQGHEITFTKHPECELHTADDDRKQKEYAQCFHLRNERIFRDVEMAGSEITYCVNCRECKVCRNHKDIEAISIKEEVEQNVINKSVKLITRTEKLLHVYPSCTIRW